MTNMKRHGVAGHSGWKRLFRTGLGALSIGVFLGGCAALQDALASMDKPTAEITGVAFESVSLDAVDLAFEVDVSNPYDVPLPLAGLDYALASEGTSFLSGDLQSPGTVPARSAKSITVPVRVRLPELLNVLSGVRPGAVVPYSASMDLGVDAPQLGRLVLPLEQSGTIPVPALPAVSVQGLQLSELTFSRVEAVLALSIENPNAFTLDVTRLDYALSIADSEVARAQLPERLALDAGRDAVVRIPIGFSPGRLGAAALSVLRGSSATYAIEGSLDAQSPFGALTLPFENRGTMPISR